MMAAYQLIVGAPVLAVGPWLVRSERKRDAALGAGFLLVGALPTLNSLFEFLWPMP